MSRGEIVNHELVLPRELCVPEVAALRAACLECIGRDGPHAAIDASSVEEVDASGVQLLLSLSRELSARGRALQLVAPSKPLLNALETLGVRALLTTPSEGALE